MTKWQTTNYKGEQVTWYSSDVVEKIKEIIKKLPDYYNSLDFEAKGHRAITIVEEIRHIIADQKESEER